MLHHPARPLSGTLHTEAPPFLTARESAPRAGPAGSETGQAEFIALIERHLVQCRRHGQALAVLSIGIDCIGTLEGQPLEGPGLESAVTLELGNRLRSRTRARDTVVRLPGLEFGVLLPGCRRQGVPGTRSRLALALGGVYVLGEAKLVASVSIGIANHTGHADNAATLWQAALHARTNNVAPEEFASQPRPARA